MHIKKLNINLSQYEFKFWNRVFRKIETECWDYIGRYTNDGYGCFDIVDGSRILAHRLAYYLYYRIDPRNKLVCHTCDNPKCCNPNHLFLGDSQDNVKDSVKKKRHSSVILKGENRPGSKLKEEQIKEIRFKRSLGFTLEMLAEEYNIDFTTIGQVVNYKTWKHIK